MLPLTICLGKLLGLYCVAVSVAMMANKRTTVAAVHAMIRDPAMILLAAIVGLAMGLAIVVGHNVWSGGALPVVVTLVGWWTAIKSLALLILPHETMMKVFETARYEKRFYPITAVTLVIGVYLTYASFDA
jgi:hypothetical protein